MATPRFRLERNNHPRLVLIDEDGFIIIEGVYSPADCRRMAEEFDRLHDLEGERGGHEVHVEPGAPRVSNIFNKTDVYDICLECKELFKALLPLLPLLLLLRRACLPLPLTHSLTESPCLKHHRRSRVLDCLQLILITSVVATKFLL